MHPVAHGLLAAHAATLRDLVLVMGKDQIDGPGVNIELHAQVLRCHGRALDMPAWEADAPGTFPVHLARGVSTLPQGEVLRRAFAFARLQLHAPARSGAQLLDGIAGQLAIEREAAHIVVDVAVRDICQALLHQLLRHVLHLWNVIGGLRAEMRRQDVQLRRILFVLPGVARDNLVGGTACRARLVLDLVLAALLDIVLQMPHVGDVAHQEDIVAVVLQHAAQPVGGDKGAKIADMDILVDRRAARVDAHAWRVKRLEAFFLARQRVIQVDR